MEGIGELLVIAVFVLITLIEGLGRRKKSGKGKERPTPEPSDVDSGAEEAPSTETVDLGRKHKTAPVGGGAEEEAPSTSSEGLVPQDVWDEILGLARGKEEAGKREKEERVDEGAETLEEIPSFEARSLEPLEPREEETRGGVEPPKRSRETIPALDKPVPAIPSSPSGRPVSVAGGTPRAGARPSGAGRSLRRRLFGEGREDLRKAVVLQEVLGPPMGMRE
jgi:hypothetical protein